MSKPAPTTYDFDQGLSGALDALRKPLKLTATLKRRALRNKAPEKVAIIGCRRASAARAAGADFGNLMYGRNGDLALVILVILTLCGIVRYSG